MNTILVVNMSAAHTIANAGEGPGASAHDQRQMELLEIPPQSLTEEESVELDSQANNFQLNTILLKTWLKDR